MIILPILPASRISLGLSVVHFKFPSGRTERRFTRKIEMTSLSAQLHKLWKFPPFFVRGVSSLRSKLCFFTVVSPPVFRPRNIVSATLKEDLIIRWLRTFWIILPISSRSQLWINGKRKAAGALWLSQLSSHLRMSPVHNSRTRSQFLFSNIYPWSQSKNVFMHVWWR